MSATLTEKRFTVHDYYRMAECGILAPDERVELIDGKIVAMSPIGGYHIGIVSWITKIFVMRVRDQARVNPQSSVRLSNTSEPEPDLAIVRNRRYGRQPPEPNDVFLLVEVSETTLS